MQRIAFFPFQFPGLDQVRCVFTSRRGGCSEPPHQEANLSFDVKDEPEAVTKNRRALFDRLELSSWQECVQVHGDAMRFDPETYKEHLMKIETLVQKPEAEPDDGAALSNHLTVLAGAMGQNIENFRYRETVMNTLITFGESYAALETQGVPLDMPAIKEGWKAMRDNLFKPADWFQ